MEDKSIFTDKKKIPSEEEIQTSLGVTYNFWKEISDYVHSKYENAFDEWNYSGGGWNLRLKDKKRVIIYLLPRDKFFKAAFVFGQKAVDEIFADDISGEIKDNLSSAKVYAEGRGIRIEIKNNNFLKDIKKLIDVNIKY